MTRVLQKLKTVDRARDIGKIMMRILHPVSSSVTGNGRQPYSGKELRAIRKKNGIGRPPIVNLHRATMRIVKTMTERTT